MNKGASALGGNKMMTMKKTLDILSKKSNELKKKYPGDAADYSFRSHVLKLLSKIAKQSIDDDKTYTPQQSGLQRFKCKTCDGNGYVERWDDYKGKEAKIIDDCDICKGEGFIMFEVVDKRKKTKSRLLYYGEEY